MSPFMIFALVLTIAYVLYYAVVVAKDLQGKKESSTPPRGGVRPGRHGGRGVRGSK